MRSQRLGTLTKTQYVVHLVEFERMRTEPGGRLGDVAGALWLNAIFNAEEFIAINIVLGLVIAWRRFRRDISGPLPDDAPQSARDAFNAEQTSRSRSIDS